MMFGLAHQLWRNGVVGLNKRNADYLLTYNERKYYPMADDKLLAKEIAQGIGINVPTLYGKFEYPHEVGNYHEVTDDHAEFVVKPACGAGGDGILVILGKTEGYFTLADGSAIDEDDMAFHLHDILAGAFSLAGQPDKALIEYCVNFDPVFDKVTYKGVPDIRIIVFCGVPVMAMLRLPTLMSAGKANLHQGALGAGISIPSGRTLTAVWRNIVVERHPDTKNTITNIEIPHWDDLLDMAARCCDLTKLNFLGIDIVLDKNRGPLMLELNARPGLNIQIANREGLLKRLELIEANIQALETASDRVAFAKQYFSPNPIAY
jgi:alpha-L-glutamate ligase-like protein